MKLPLLHAIQKVSGDGMLRAHFDSAQVSLADAPYLIADAEPRRAAGITALGTDRAMLHLFGLLVEVRADLPAGTVIVFAGGKIHRFDGLNSDE